MKRILATLLLSYFGQAVASQQPTPATVSGTILRKANDAPLAGAAVELSRPGAPAGTGYTATTGTDGKFTFKDIPPGDYKLASTRSGYVRGEYGQRGPNSGGTIFTLTTGQEMRDTKIALMEAGAIAGRILDRKGAPLAYVQVQALRYTYQGGNRALTPVRVAVTNDLGEYRLYWLPPGQYAVMAMPLRADMPDQVITGTGSYSIINSVRPPAGAAIVLVNEDAPLATFYPGTLKPEAAQPLPVRSGEDIRGIDLTMTPVALRVVRGVVLNVPPPQPAAAVPGIPVRITVRLASRNPSSGVILTSGSQATGTAVADPRTGAFEIRGVQPGSYFLIAEAGSINTTSMFGSVPIEVADADVPNVSVPLAAGFGATLRVTAAEPDVSLDFNRARFFLSGTTVPRSMPTQQVPQQPGVFSASSILPGDYSVNLNFIGTEPFGTVKSVKVDGVEYKGAFHLEGPPSSPIEVVIATKQGIIQGSAVSTTQQPISAVTVVAVPVTTGSFRNAVSDAKGNFTLNGLSAGDYRVFAFEDIEMYAWQSRDYMRPYENRGRLVHLEEGGKETVQVTAIPPGQ